MYSLSSCFVAGASVSCVLLAVLACFLGIALLAMRIGMPMPMPRTDADLEAYHCKVHPLRGCRVGEAKSPGPSEPLSPARVRRRVKVKSPRPVSAPPTPVSVPDTALDSQHSSVAETSHQCPTSELRKMLRLSLRRATGKPCLLSCAMIYSKSTWRWRIRSQPPLSGTECCYPHEALEGFLGNHSEKLDPESQEIARAHTATLSRQSQLYADLMAKSVAKTMQSVAFVTPPPGI